MKRMFVLGTLVATVMATSIAIAPAHAAQAETKKVCDVNWKIVTVLNTVPQEPSDADIAKIEKRLDPLFDQAEANAPTEIEPQVTAVVAAIRTTGLLEVQSDPTFQENISAIDAWVVDNCGYQVVNVDATEYHFEGIPKTLKTGKTVFVVNNEGAEVHMLLNARIKTKTPLRVLLADEKKGEKETEEVGGVAFAVGGQTAYAYADLKKPGRYVAICFIPVGQTDPNAQVDGPPHFTEGMVQEYKVKK